MTQLFNSSEHDLALMSRYLCTARESVSPCIVNCDYEASGLEAALFRLHCIAILIV